MKIPARRFQLPQPMRHIHQTLGDHVAHLAAGGFVTLPHAVHGHQAGPKDHVTKLLFDGLPDDHIDAAGFILQRDKDDTLGGTRLLAHGDQTAGAHEADAGATEI